MAYGRRRKQSGMSTALLGVGAFLALLAFGGIMAFTFLNQGEEYGKDLCPSSGPKSAFALVADMTEELTLTERRAARQQIEGMVDNLPPDTLVVVGIVSEDPQYDDHLFAICKPRTGADASELYENPRLIRERYEREFKSAFDAAFDQAFAGAGATQSPIIESIQSILRSAPKFLDGDFPKQLVIVSDMIQNSEVFTFYEGHTWDEFEESPYFQRISANLGGLVVQICKVSRPAPVDFEEVDNFWVRYFEKKGVYRVRKCDIGDL